MYYIERLLDLSEWTGKRCMECEWKVKNIVTCSLTSFVIPSYGHTDLFPGKLHRKLKYEVPKSHVHFCELCKFIRSQFPILLICGVSWRQPVDVILSGKSLLVSHTWTTHLQYSPRHFHNSPSSLACVADETKPRYTGV